MVEQTKPPVRSIPRIIHQCCPDKHSLRIEYIRNIEEMRERNPGYDFRLYDNADMADFVASEMSGKVREQFFRITDDYGAAKADFFRYLMMYQAGGIYLDIKSSGTLPFDEVIRAEDRYILSQWQNHDPDHQFYGWGVYDELAAIPRGEYQQWHIIAAPGHAYLGAVIEAVAEKLERYRPWTTGFGHFGVVRTTGPITYTQAIEAIRDKHPHRLIKDETVIGLRYSILEKKHDHRVGRLHYGRSFNPVARLPMPLSLAGAAYLSYKEAYDRFVTQPLRSKVHQARAARKVAAKLRGLKG